MEEGINEQYAKMLREKIRPKDLTPDELRKELGLIADNLDEYSQEHFPANEKGQIHFIRAVMESAADLIRAQLTAPPERG